MDPSGSESEHVLFACTYNFKVKWLLHVLLKFLCLQLATGNLQAICNDDEETDPQAPECLDDCRGRRFFLDRDGICKMCVQCIAGYEHDKECGNGENGDAICILCPEDHYSYNLYDCVACRVCENTLITQECSASTDRQCGECLPGFYKDPQNPDLCNQRCEWLTNPDTIPACKAWLVTTLSAGISLTSSSPGIIDEGTGRETMTIVIIIVLVILVIGGSVIPLYLCCKRCTLTSSKPPQVLLSVDIGTGNGSEHPEPADGDGNLTELVRAQQVARGASEEANDLPLATGAEQDGAGFEEQDSNEERDESQKLLPDAPLSSTESTAIGQIDDDEPMPTNSDSEVAQRSAGGAGDDEKDGEQDGGKEEPDEHQKLLPDAPLQSRESTVISQDDDKHMPTGSDSEEAQRSVIGAGDDVQDGGNECHRLLPNEQEEDHGGGARGSDNGEWKGSAEEESSKPKKRKKKDGPRRTNTLQMASTCKCCNKCNPNITVQIGHVETVVMGNQTHNHHSAEHPPQDSDEYPNEEDENN